MGTYAVPHPMKNGTKLYLIYDPVHLLKNIRNNWVSEKSQTLKLFDFESSTYIYAKWKDTVDIYKEELDIVLKSTKLNRQSLWPNNFEKQKVHLVLNVFDEKVVARLEQKDCPETACFLKIIIRMWKILNISSPNSGERLNNVDQLPIRTDDDSRFTFLSQMGTSFKLMDNGLKGDRRMGLSGETSDTLHTVSVRNS